MNHFSLSTYAIAMLLAACSSESPKPESDADAGRATYAGGAGGVGGASGAGGAAGGGTTINAKARCRLPDGWPTLSSVLDMAEALPDTGDVDHMVMTPRGLHWIGDVTNLTTGLYRLGADGKPMLLAMSDDALFAQLVASDSAVAWLWSNNLWALSLDAGAAPAEIGTGINLTGTPLLIDNTYVYYEPAFSTAGFTQVPLAGGAPTKVPTQARDVIAVHNGYAYFGESDSLNGDLLKRAPLEGGAVEQVDNSLGFIHTPQFVFDGSVMYVSTTRISRIELGAPNSATALLVLASAPHQGTDNYLTSMALAGDRLVYADGNGTVGWVSTDGSRCENILVDPDQGSEVAGPPIEIALDDQYLYLLVATGPSAKGSLYRIARASVGL